MIVGWAMMTTQTVFLVQLAFWMACVECMPLPAGCIFHSDKGSQYDCKEFRTDLAEKHFRQSMGSTGDCFDNAVTESAFSTIKLECLFGKVFATQVAARSHLFDYIEAFYNKVRRHTANANLSPEEFERRWFGG
jgi:transposase InsO family protein